MTSTINASSGAHPTTQSSAAPARRRRRNGGPRTSPLALALIYGALAVLSAVVLYPLLWLLVATFKPSAEFGSNLSIIPNNPTLQNYATVWDGIAGVPMWRFFANSTLVATIAVVAILVSASMAAYAFGRIQFRGRGVFFACMIATLLLPFHVVIIPQYILFNRLDMINTYVPLLVGKFLAADAFFVFLIVQFIRNIPREMDEAARVDGAGHVRIFFSIMLPLIKPALITSAIFTFIWTWGDFFGPLIYLTDPEKYTLPVALRLFNDATSASDYGATVTAGFLALVPVLLFFLVFQRMLIQGVSTQGLKG